MEKIPPFIRFCHGACCVTALLLLLLTAFSASAQDYPTYTPGQTCTTSPDLPLASQKICSNLSETLPQINQTINGYAKQVVKRLDSKQGDIPTRTLSLNGNTFDKIPIRPEKDLNDGHYPRGKSWTHYTGDSRTVLHVQRFVECFEPRQVVKHPIYNSLCELNCPATTSPNWPCHTAVGQPQKNYVWEYYVPEYEIIVAKAGSHSIDPLMFGGMDNRPEFLRSKTSQSQLQSHDPGALEKLKSAHGIPTDLWPGNPEWRQGEFLLQQGEESFDVTQAHQVYAKAAQPNFVWRFADLRPGAWWQGWSQNSLSAAWCWPQRAKEVFSNSNDQQQLWQMSNIVEYTKLVSPEMWQATVDLPTDIQEVGRTEEIPQGLEPSFHRARYKNPYEDLKRLDIQPQMKAGQEKYVFYGGTIGPLTTSRFNGFTDPLRRDFFIAATAAWQFGSISPALKAYNTPTRRQSMLTYHTNRGSRPGYEGAISKPFNIQVIDKFNNVWPGKERSTSGAPGEPTRCGRPNNVPNMENDDNWPKHLASRLEYDGETRWIFWNKRIACACETCGFFRGCLTLNNGDWPEDTFEGTIPGTVVGGGGLPPPFEQARPHWLRLARATSPRSAHPAHIDGFNIPGLRDGGTPGPMSGILSPDEGIQPPNSSPGNESQPENSEQQNSEQPEQGGETAPPAEPRVDAVVECPLGGNCTVANARVKPSLKSVAPPLRKEKQSDYRF